ncbi:MAG: hypothetical protein ABH896_00005, partial [Candidatus Jacksonbacteria bacterium]
GSIGNPVDCGAQEDYASLPDVSWPRSDPQKLGQFNHLSSHIEYTHFGTGINENDYNFDEDTYYSLLIPNTLQNVYQDSLKACELISGACERCCQALDDIVVWDFYVGDKNDIVPPEVISASPYYDKDFYEIDSQPDLSELYISRNIPQTPKITINFSEGILSSSIVYSYSATTVEVTTGRLEPEWVSVYIGEGEADNFSVGERVIIIADQAKSEESIILGKGKDTPERDYLTVILEAGNVYDIGSKVMSFAHPQAGKFVLEEVVGEMTQDMQNNPGKNITGSQLKMPYDGADRNFNFLAEIINSNKTLQLSTINPDSKYLLKDNTWYRIALTGVQDLCGLSLVTANQPNPPSPLTLYWLFQVNGLSPDFSLYPASGSEKVCLDVEVWALALGASMNDPVIPSCEPGIGYVTEWSLEPAITRTELVTADCYKYSFADIAGDTKALLSPNTTYTAKITTRYPLPDGGVLQTDDPDNPDDDWTFITAEDNENCIRPPMITSIKPCFGPSGECITISGDYFTDQQDVDDEGVYIAPEGTTDDDFPTSDLTVFFEKAGSWSKNIIIATIPGLSDDPDFGTTPDDEHPIKVAVDAKEKGFAGLFYSNSYPFDLREGLSSGPCLYSVKPSPYYRSQEETLTGIRFGSAQGKVKYNSEDSTISDWQGSDSLTTETTVISTIPLKEITTASGKDKDNVEVVLYAGGAIPKASNPYPITLPVLKGIFFAERNVCEQNLRISPNPKNEQSNVCILGEGLPDDLSQAQLNIYLEF